MFEGYGRMGGFGGGFRPRYGRGFRPRFGRGFRPGFGVPFLTGALFGATLTPNFWYRYPFYPPYYPFY